MHLNIILSSWPVIPHQILETKKLETTPDTVNSNKKPQKTKTRKRKKKKSTDN